MIVFKKSKIENQEILSKMYDFVLNPDISERERKIGLMAKKDLEKNRYTVAVVNKVMVSLQREAMTKRLTPAAAAFYHELEPILNKIAPIGTNRGWIMFHNSYLD
ncbi:bacteriocin immunity protein [Liquorilactobacillus capillatus]|uniref:bacteriocin immunity protein n=1 Tax=Liquorilactobacillus capillatus TaxID=480931 RepID=UPI003B83325B